MHNAQKCTAGFVNYFCQFLNLMHGINESIYGENNKKINKLAHKEKHINQ